MSISSSRISRIIISAMTAVNVIALFLMIILIEDIIMQHQGGRMDAFNAILTRRSTRKYTSEVPAKDTIERILETGRYAPSGGNNQTTHFLVITDPEILSELAGLVRNAFAGMEIREIGRAHV